jgi:hypothetical protein
MNGGEWLCLWYLRLNGYFTIPNFIVHGRPAALTDVDVLAVRLPYSSESRFIDDGELGIPKDRIDIIFAEAKRGEIRSLNGPWRDPHAGALNRVLQRVGIVPPDRVGELAAELYMKRSTSENGFTIRICAFGEKISPELRQSGVHFVDWQHVLQFVHQRFRDNEQFKADHGMWDKFGQYLWGKLNGQEPCEPEALFNGWNEQKSPQG